MNFCASHRIKFLTVKVFSEIICPFCSWSPCASGSLGKEHLPNNRMVQDASLTEDLEVS